MTGTDASELMSLERCGWDALSRGRGRVFYGELMAENAVIVVPGAVLNKEQTLASWDGVPPWRRYVLVERAVVDLGGIAFVTYDVEAQRDDEAPYRAAISTVYAKHAQGWRLVLHQQTPTM